jgi:acetylornithine deacetylase/succinyl-diaminopimelate desuccinylase family protein
MTPQGKATRAALRALDDQETLALAQSLVRINSVNPNLDQEGQGEWEVVDFLRQRARAEGLAVHSEEVAPNRHNLLCTHPGAREEIALLFLAHTDTVPYLGMESPLSGEVRQGAIWGRGSVDMKGGLAAALQALIALARCGVQLEKSVALAAVVDEESEHRGAYHLAQSGLQAEACLITEPSNLEIMLGCKGTAPICIQVEGHLAHGSAPWLGVNAIEKAVRIIQSLRELDSVEVEIERLAQPVRSSLNIGVIEGGTAYNNVPDRCALYLDRRMVPGENQARILAELEGLVEQLQAEDPDLRAQVLISRPDWHWGPIQARGLNPAYTPADGALVRSLSACSSEVLGQEPALGFSNGYNDMDFMVNDLGIPTVNLGPGQVSLAHHREERLAVDQLLAAARIYLRTALALARDNSTRGIRTPPA